MLGITTEIDTSTTFCNEFEIAVKFRFYGLMVMIYGFYKSKRNRKS